MIYHHEQNTVFITTKMIPISDNCSLRCLNRLQIYKIERYLAVDVSNSKKQAYVLLFFVGKHLKFSQKPGQHKLKLPTTVTTSSLLIFSFVSNELRNGRKDREHNLWESLALKWLCAANLLQRFVWRCEYRECKR